LGETSKSQSRLTSTLRSIAAEDGSAATVIVPQEEVREKFKRVKPLKEIYKIKPGLYGLLSKKNQNEGRGIIAETERSLPQRGTEDAKTNRRIFLLCAFCAFWRDATLSAFIRVICG